MYPERASELRRFLIKRLENVTKPFDVLPLAKADHLDSDGSVRDERALVRAIEEITESLPQLGALFDWERRVLGAAGSTVSSLLELVSTCDVEDQPGEVGRVLSRVAIEAVGRDHVDSDRFRAVNEGLLPILADRIANLRASESNDEIWRAAMDVADRRRALSLERAARLNRLAHIADAAIANGPERGRSFRCRRRLE